MTEPSVRYEPISPLDEPQSLDDIVVASDAILGTWNQLVEALGSDRVKSVVEAETWRAAVETGLLEHLYAFGDALTEAIVQYGLAAEEARALEDSTYSQIAAHRHAHDVMVQAIHDGRPLSVSLVKELHAAVTGAQSSYQAHDQFGRPVLCALNRGQFKRSDNHVRLASDLHFYAPWLQVDSEMDRLIGFLEQYDSYPPVVVASYVHHRFTAIHPFEDGNGRVARLLGDYYLIRSGLLPLVIGRRHRAAYLDALHVAD